MNAIIDRLNAVVEEVSRGLRAAIEAMGQSEASRRSGIKQPDISAWMSGRRKWRVEKQASVLGALSKNDDKKTKIF